MKLISVSLSFVAVTSAFDCSDGDNGGCSHYCNPVADTCDCPTCWSIEDDSMTCKPSADKIGVTCGHDGMTIVVDECVYTDGAETIMLGFGADNTCTSSQTDQSLTISTELDGCGTASAVDGETITFSNSVVVTDRTHPFGIVLMNDVDVNVSCVFSASVSDITANLEVSSPTQTAGSDGVGTFRFFADYYTDPDFTEETSETDLKVVGEDLYFGIRPLSVIQGVSFYVNECAVSQADNVYNVWETMCPNVAVVSANSGFLETEMFKLTYQAFTFNGATGGDMSIDCGVTVCLEGQCPDAPSC